jgi:hypothetical protein
MIGESSRRGSFTMSRGLAILALVVLINIIGVGAIAAEPITPGGGSAFGNHVASMAPGHPQSHGQMFGECVSTMATTGVCPHHQ